MGAQGSAAARHKERLAEGRALGHPTRLALHGLPEPAP